MPQLDNGKVVQFNEETASSITKPKSLNAVKPVSKIVEIASKIAVNNVKIIKKDGTKEDYDVQKVVKAVKKSAARMLVEFSDKELEDICNYVNWSVLESRQNEIEIFKMFHFI